MSGARDDARRAAEAWLARNGICSHDTGLSVICPECAATLASVIDGVAESRGRGSTVGGNASNSTEPLTEYGRLRSECDALIDRLHAGLEVMSEMAIEEPDDDCWLRGLREFRIALLRLAYDHSGDPEAEETLSREGHTT